MKNRIVVTLMLMVLGCVFFSGCAFKNKSDSREKLSFRESVKKYVKTGLMFEDYWNGNYDRQVLGVELSETKNGSLFATVDLEDCGRRYFEIYSLALPLPDEITWKMRARHPKNEDWSLESIERNNTQAIGIIFAIPLYEDGCVSHGIIRAGYHENGRWDIDDTYLNIHDNYAKYYGDTGAAEWFYEVNDIYLANPELREKYLERGIIGTLKKLGSFTPEYMTEEDKWIRGHMDF